MKKASLPLKWHGGKQYLADRIIELMPPHVHYVEPYFGGGAVLFNKPMNLVEGHSEVVNDVYGDLIKFWLVLQSPVWFPEFQRRMTLTPLSKAHFECASMSESKDPVNIACNFFIRYRQSRQGLGKDFATMSRSRTRRGMNEQISSWLSAVEGLQEAHERMMRVVIFNEEATKVIEREDSKDTLFYVDPPYMAQTRVAKSAYEHEMTFSQHDHLLDTLGAAKGKFVLSGYRSELYDNSARHFGWNRVDIKIDNKASSKKVKPVKTECLWMNY